MKVFLKFFKTVLVWTAILLVLLSGITLVTGGGVAGVLGNLPFWGGLAFVLSAFPAGVSVVDDVFPRSGGIDFRMSGVAAAATLTLALLTFVLVAYVGPAAVSGGELGEPNAMSLGTLKAEARTAAQAMERRVGLDGLSLDWRETNILVWHYTRRLAGVVQPLLFGTIGLLLAFWARRVGKREFVQLTYWAMGLFLVVSTYLAGENSFELVVLQAAGPVFFAGMFVLIIPPVLVLGLAIPTVVLLWTGESKVSAA